MSEADNTATLVGKRDEQATVSQAESDTIHAFGRIRVSASSRSRHRSCRLPSRTMR